MHMETVKVLTRTQAVRFNDDGSVEHTVLEKGMTLDVRQRGECSTAVWITGDAWIFPKYRAYLMTPCIRP